MSIHEPGGSLCAMVEDRLSAFFDDELPPLERLGIERHLESCVKCRNELELLAQASRLLRAEGRRVPKPPSWAGVRDAARAARSRRGLREWLAAHRSLAASILLIALATLLFTIARVDGPPERRHQGIGDPAVQLAGLPGLDRFLSQHQAVEVPVAELGERVAFYPQVPEELPGGYRLQSAYVVQSGAGPGSCLVYRNGDQLVGLVQNAPSRELSWEGSRMRDCTVDGRACRTGRSREVELLQIEPDGRNLTVVAPTGVLDPVALVRTLAEEGIGPGDEASESAKGDMTCDPGS